jgi:hypothetical protein
VPSEKRTKSNATGVSEPERAANVAAKPADPDQPFLLPAAARDRYDLSST